MIGTLIKHEAIRTKGLLVTIFAAAAVLAAGGSLIAATGWPVVTQIGVVLGIAGAVVSVPAVQLGMGIEYWRSSYRRIGYFTQTLPIKGSHIYWAKLVWALVAMVASLLWSVVLALVVWFGTARSFGARPMDIFGLVGDFLGQAAAIVPGWFWVAAPLLLLVLMSFNVVVYFFSASIGSEKRLLSLGVAGPIVVWFIVYTVGQLVTFALMLVIPFGLGITAAGDFGVVVVNLWELMVTNQDAEALPLGFVPAFVALIVLMMWRTVVSWNHKVSLA